MTSSNKNGYNPLDFVPISFSEKARKARRKTYKRAYMKDYMSLRRKLLHTEKVGRMDLGLPKLAPPSNPNYFKGAPKASGQTTFVVSDEQIRTLHPDENGDLTCAQCGVKAPPEAFKIVERPGVKKRSNLRRVRRAQNRRAPDLSNYLLCPTCLWLVMHQRLRELKKGERADPRLKEKAARINQAMWDEGGFDDNDNYNYND